MRETCAACGFENGPEFEEVPVYITRGKRKGELSHKETRETHNPQWIEIEVERGFGFVESKTKSWRDIKEGVRLYVCPNCKTVRAI